jgi:hypothetical protein
MMTQNPSNKIPIIQKIIYFSLKINNEKSPKIEYKDGKKITIIFKPRPKNEFYTKNLGIYFEVNRTWRETVIHHLDFVWELKDDDGWTMWHKAVKYLKSDFFWEYIANNDDKWFKKYWDRNNTGEVSSVWCQISGKVMPDKFWEIIAKKPDEWFKRHWGLDLNKKNTQWRHWWSFCHIKSDKFWEIIANKDDAFFDKFFSQEDEYDSLWGKIADNVESKNFWGIIASKDDEWFERHWSRKNSRGEPIWNEIIGGRNINLSKFWDIISQKPDFFFEKFWTQSDKNGWTGWHKAFRGIKSEKFWEIIYYKPNSFFDDNFNLEWKCCGHKPIWHAIIDKDFRSKYYYRITKILKRFEINNEYNKINDKAEKKDCSCVVQ